MMPQRRRYLAISALSSTLAVGLLPTGTQAQPPAEPQHVSPTRALYNFHRDDAATTTHVRIDVAKQGPTPISQYVFGNFIEHLGNVIYDALWANVLSNPNVERIKDSDTVPERWEWSGGAAWAEGGYQSPRAVRLSGAGQTLSQRVFLPVHRIRRYTLTFWGKPASRLGRLSVALYAGGEETAGAAPIVEKEIAVSGTDWRAVKVKWEIPEGALQKGQAARFVVRGADALAGEAGTVDVDQFELMPDDAVDGMDPDTLRMAKAWNIPILRLAGNFSSGYHWRDGIGPRESRPTQPNVAWGGGIETNHFGTPEFFALAHDLGNVPTQIAVNAGNGTPEEAADWVRYCEEHHDKVAIWEIGNELYGGWQIGHTDPAGMASRYVAFRDAMLKVDPNLTLMATGKGDEFLSEGMTRNRDWNTTVLRAAVAGGAKAPDYLTIHPLVAMPGDLRERPYSERWESAMAHPYYMDQTLFPDLIQQIESVEGPNATTRIAPTEWGVIIGGDGWRESPTHDAMSGAVYNALALNAFLRNGDRVTLANMTAFLHGGCIRRDHSVVYVDPQYYTQKMYADAQPTEPVATDWSGPGKDVPQRGFLPAATNVPDVDVFSALTADKSHLSVFLVNRTLSDSRSVTLDVSGFAPGRTRATILTSDDPQVGNNWQRPNTVEPHPFTLPAVKNGGWTITLPPHAVVVLQIARK